MNLHCDKRENGDFAFYIDGDLQFDTADEALYHESLVLPAMSLAQLAKPDNLRVLICGGGDGLALRETLRFPGVVHADLVDYSEAVVEWGRTRFAEINQGAFEDSRAHTHIGDAWDFLADAGSYDAIFCDFTVPRCAEDTRVFTRDWYERIQRALAPGGIAAFNAVSAQYALDAFWCVEKTVRAAQLHTRPYRVCIPSFRAQGYGAWGFLLAAHRPIKQTALRNLECPIPTRQAEMSGLWRGAQFSRAERLRGKSAPVHTLEHSVLLPLILNPDLRGSKAQGGVASPDQYNLEPLVSLIPIVHSCHTRTMIETLAEQVIGSVRALDLRKLTDALLERSKELPGELIAELRRLRDFLSGIGSGIAWLSQWSRRLFVALVILMTLANAVSPDSAFGKGSFGSGHGGISAGHASVGRGYSSFSGSSGFSSSGHASGGSFGGKSGFSGGAVGRTGGSFSGTRGLGSSFGTRGSAAHGPLISRPVITSTGFRGGYGSGRPTDIYGRSYEPRTFIYVHSSGGGYYGQGANPVSNGTEGKPHQALFMADADMLVMDNGDILVPVSETGYLLVVGGTVSLYSKSSPEPLLALYPDARFFQNIAVQLEGQQAQAQFEIKARRDWLSWVGWTSAMASSVRDDETELRNLEDLDRRLTEAQKHLVLPPDDQPSSSRQNSTDVELFLDCVLTQDDRIAFRAPDDHWLHTDGKRLRTEQETTSGQGRVCPPALTALLKSVMDKLSKELAADSKSFASDLSQAQQERTTIQKDLAEYQRIYSAGGDSSESVDYGTEEISVSNAINRTQNDLAVNQQDIDAAIAGASKADSDAQRIMQARQTFGQ